MEILTEPFVIEYASLPLQLTAIGFISVTLIALVKTRKLPKTTKYLNIGLLLFDLLAIACYMLFTFFNEESIPYTVLVKCTLVLMILSHLTVTIMALDRLIAINWPNKYLQLVYNRKPWKVIIITWVLVSVLIHLHGTVICSSVSFGDLAISLDTCTVAHVVLVSIMFILNVVVPIVCYLAIFRIVRNQSMRTSVRTKAFFHQYKSTSVVLLYMINIGITTIFYFAIYIIVMSKRHRIFFSSIIFLIHGLVDTCSYVLWFKECQLELLKIAVICFPRVRPRIEPMRIQVFNICTLRKI